MATPAQQVDAGVSAAGIAIDTTRTLFGGTRQQGLRAGTSRFLQQGWFLGWKVSMSMYCIIWAAWWDRGEDLDIRVYLTTWTHLIATAYFVLSTISAILCMVYLARERPHPVEEGKPKRPDPVKATRSPVPCYFRYLQHISWVLACISSMIVSVVFWMAIYDRDIPVSSVHISTTILAGLMVVDQFLIASEFKIGFAWMGLYFFIVYIFYNVIYYYEHNEEDRVSFEVFDWDPEPGKACLWVFLILTFFVPGFTAFHVFVYRLRERMYDSYKHIIEPVEEEPPPKTDTEEKEAKKEEEKDKKKEEEKDKKKDNKKDKKKDVKDDAPAPPPPLPPAGYYYPGGYPPGTVPVPVPYELGPPPQAPPAAGGTGAKIKDAALGVLRDLNVGL